MRIRAFFSVCVLTIVVGASQAQAPPARSSASQFESAPQSNTANSSFMVLRAEVPLYPALAKAARQAGTVRVRVSVKGGAVVNTETRSSAHLVLVNAAKDNVKTWQFASDVEGSFEVIYVYELEKEEVVVPENPRVEMNFPFLVKITARPVKPISNYGGRRDGTRPAKLAQRSGERPRL